MAFDVVQPVKLGQGPLSPGAALFYTTPTKTRTLVKTIDIVNTNNETVTATVYLVPFGDSPNDDNTLIPSITMTANEIFQWEGTEVLNTGDTIQAESSQTGVTIHMSGGEAV